MKDNHFLAARINQSFKSNAGKAIFSTCLLLVSQMIIMVVLVMLLQLFPVFFAMPLAVLSALAILVMQYGYMTLLYKLYTGSRAIIGDMFSGFRDIKRIGNAALLFFGVDFASIIISILIAAVFSAAVPFISADFSRMLLVVFALYGATVVTVLIRFAFVWFSLFANPLLKAKDAFKKSAHLLIGNKRRLLLLCLQAGGAYLFCALSLYVLNFMLFPMPLPDLSAFGIQAATPRAFPVPDGVSTVLNIGYYITSTIALIKVVLALAAFYTELSSPDISLAPKDSEALLLPGD
jgi:hypothetical protein